MVAELLHIPRPAPLYREAKIDGITGQSAPLLTPRIRLGPVRNLQVKKLGYILGLGIGFHFCGSGWNLAPAGPPFFLAELSCVSLRRAFSEPCCYVPWENAYKSRTYTPNSQTASVNLVFQETARASEPFRKLRQRHRPIRDVAWSNRSRYGNRGIGFDHARRLAHRRGRR
jgi:hypothetical protein